MLMASVGHLLATVAFRQHDHTPTSALELVNIRVHTPGSGWTKRTRGIAFRRFCRTGVVDRVILNILRQTFAVIQPFFQFRMRNITANNDCTVKRQTRRYRVLRQLGQDLFHRAIEVNVHRFPLSRLAQLFWYIFARIMLQFFDPDTFAVDLSFDISIG